MNFLTLILFSVLLSQPNLNVEKVRNQFPEITSEEQADNFIEELKNDSTPEARAYTAAMVFMKSRFVKWPFKKMKYFKEGKSILDKTINENPSNIEIRYIRFLMQKQIPDFLGYNENVSEDFQVIVKGFKMCNLKPMMKSEILQNMLLTKDLTSEEHAKLNQLLNQV
ncbi:MAG: hypothetical protein IZT56_01095 [Bacteroidetes bacterium]|nr:hypothetical protein [Bacteroidota bacterium]